MTHTLSLTSGEQDLAGNYSPKPTFWQTQRRIDHLIDRYLSLAHLDDRLRDLPAQFEHPQARPWKSIDWHDIDAQQVVGIDSAVFLAVLRGAIDTEAPIRQYTQTSRQYLEKLHPQLARFVGGVVDENGTLMELGLWEKEERQHTPALSKIYARLADEKIAPTPREARTYQPSTDPHTDLYRHGLHRIATEYGATCLYLWLMAHSTGTLQSVLEELVWDEINHMTKFWGYGIWAFPESSIGRIGWLLLQTSRGKLTYRRDRSSLFGTLHRMASVLGWQSWRWSDRATFAYTCAHTLQQLWRWNNRIKREDLEDFFGRTPSDSERVS